MAGQLPGASAPIHTSATPLAPQLHHLPATTRTHRTFCGVVLVGGELVTVGASRRARECHAVHLQVYDADGAQHLVRGLLTAVQACQLARALIEAASAVDQAQRQPQFTRGAA